MTETQMTLLAHWLIIGGIWFMLVFYGLAVLSKVSYDQMRERRKIMPTRPAAPQLAVYGIDTVERRAWPMPPMSALGMPRHEWHVMARRVREYHARLQ